jgi:hypothetical protein
MTPKEKAKELIDKFKCVNYDLNDIDSHKEGAFIAVDEIIDALEKYDELTEKHLKDEFDVTYFSCELQNMDSDFRYWQQVKQEILAL